MTDKRNGLFASVLKGILFIVSWFYGIISNIIRLFYSRKAGRPGCKVISIGNLTLGGTGKTPTACMLAKRLAGQDKKVAVLIRGYGDDEWKMIKDMLEPIPVIVGPDRVKNSRHAVSEFGVDTVILDDGFQHWKIKKDLDIVLIDSSNPFGNGRLFPRGVLREGLASLKRAGIIMLTKTDMGRDNVEKIKNTIKKIFPEIEFAETVYRPDHLYNLSTKERVGLAAIKGKSIASLSSIVNTEYFEFILKNLGASLKLQLHYPDHHNYTQKDIDNIMEKCKEQRIDTIVTTEKDAVKLKAYSLQLTAVVLHIEPEVIKGEEVLTGRLTSLYRN